MEKGLNVVGWNRYTEINLKYENQVVCKKSSGNRIKMMLMGKQKQGRNVC